jgi:serine/threonine-protein phosphatase 2A regulatory subunit B'
VAKEEVPASTSSSKAVAISAPPSNTSSKQPSSGPGGAPPRGANLAARGGPSAGGLGAGPGGAQGGAAGQGGGGAREKPGLPVLTEASMRSYFAEPLPSFRDVPPAEKQLLFVQKLHLCSFSFDFSDPSKTVREKELKRQTLLELVDYANSGQGKFTEAVSEDIVFMLSQNLFRTLPPSRSHDVDNFDPEEEEPLLEPAWPHLQVRV